MSPVSKLIDMPVKARCHHGASCRQPHVRPRHMEITSPTASGRPLVSFASVGRENTAKSADDRLRPGEMSLAGRTSDFAVTCLFTTLTTRKRRVPTDAGKRLLRR